MLISIKKVGVYQPDCSVCFTLKFNGKLNVIFLESSVGLITSLATRRSVSMAEPQTTLSLEEKAKKEVHSTSCLCNIVF